MLSTDLNSLDYRKMNSQSLTALKHLVKHLGIKEDAIRLTADGLHSSPGGLPHLSLNRFMIYARADTSGYLGGFYLSSKTPRRPGATTIAKSVDGVVCSEDEGGLIVLLGKHPPIDPLREVLGLPTIGKRRRRSRAKLYRPMARAA